VTFGHYKEQLQAPEGSRFRLLRLSISSAKGAIQVPRVPIQVPRVPIQVPRVPIQVPVGAFHLVPGFPRSIAVLGKFSWEERPGKSVLGGMSWEEYPGKSLLGERS
jgi:hypothetical protein